MTIGSVFLESSIKRFKEYKAMGDASFAQLQDADFLYQPSATSNSIAVIIKHLNGNMQSRWTNFLEEDGEKPWRLRDEEFEAGTGSKEEWISKWEEGWAVLINTLEGLTENDLLKTVTIRTQTLLVIDAIIRQQAHYSAHVGQIVYLAKTIRGEAWKTLSIPKGGSQAYNQSMSKA